MSPVSEFHELLAAAKLNPPLVDLEIHYEVAGCGAHVCSVTCDIDGQEYTGQGTGPIKRTAKMQAFDDLLSVAAAPLREKIAAVRAAISPLSPDILAKPFMYQCIKTHLQLAAEVCRFERRPVVVICDKLPSNAEPISFEQPETGRMINYHRVIDGHNIMVYALSSTVQAFDKQLRLRAVDVYLAQPCTRHGDSDSNVILDTVVVPNSSPREMPVEPVAQVGVQDNPGTATVPHLPNPQPTAVTPAVAAQDPSLVAALEPLAPHELLNPLGPPNMLGVGGVTFDIKDLIYSQYIDCDTQYQYTDDTAQGKIIFQIPYDPTGPLVNPYIRQWLSMHPRYTGALNFRFTVVGNSTFSGLIGFAWYPRQIEAQTVKVSEMMKYSYTTMGINQPSNRIFTLFDARQTQFWRDTGDDPKLNPRPVIVCFIYMTAVSPLREGITIRIRVASKLSDGADGPAFIAAMPTIPGNTPNVGVPAPTGLNVNYVNSLVGLPVVPVLARPLSTLNPLYVCLDGDVYSHNFFSMTIGDKTFDSGTTGFGTCWINPVLVGALSTGFMVNSNGKVCGYVDNSHYTGPEPIGKGYEGIISQKVDLFYDFTKIGQDFTGDGVEVTHIVTLGGYSFEGNYLLFNLNETTLHRNDIQAMLINIIYTSAGPLIVYQYYLKDMIDGAKVMYFPLSNGLKTGPIDIIASVWADGFSPETMPAGWRNIAITCDAPYRTPSGITSPNLYSHPSVQNFLRELNIPVSKTQCIAFTLSDVDSGTDLVFARYYPDRNAVIVNLGENPDNSLFYATLKRPSIRLYLSALDVIERSNTFPITLSSNFSTNVPNAELSRRREPYDPRSDGIIIPNAWFAPAMMAAGEGAKGIGGALGSVGNYFAQKEQREWMGEQSNLERELKKWLAEYQGGNMFQYQENQNSFLSALSEQNSNQWLFNQKELSAFNYEMAGYLMPSTQRGLNRAGLGFTGGPPTSNARIYRNSGTQASPETMSSSTQVVSPPGRDITTQGTQTGNQPVGATPKNPNVKLRRSNAFRSYDRSNAQSFGALPQRRMALTTAGASEC